MTIWKFVLQARTFQTIAMPEQAQILCAAAQGEDICIWAKVKPDAPYETRDIEVYGTGHPMSENSNRSKSYIGTAFLPTGLVFHVFELKR
jgi:hypothetical protein